MSRKHITAVLLFFVVSIALYFFLQTSQTMNQSVSGTVAFAARENKLLPFRAIQVFVLYHVETEHSIPADNLLPDSMKNDPWGTPYECRYKDEKFLVHSAGPDKIMSQRPLKPCDDILVFRSCIIDCSASLEELNDMLHRYSEPLIAEVLLNCDDSFYRDAAESWITAHGYTTSIAGFLGKDVW